MLIDPRKGLLLFVSIFEFFYFPLASGRKVCMAFSVDLELNLVRIVSFDQLLNVLDALGLRQLTYCSNFVGVFCIYPSFTYPEPQELPGSEIKHTFLRVQLHLILAKSYKLLLQFVNVSLLCHVFDNAIVHRLSHLTLLFCKYLFHHIMVCSPCVLQPKQHYFIGVHTGTHDEGSFINVGVISLGLIQQWG